MIEQTNLFNEENNLAFKHGFLLIDKAVGLNSFKLVLELRRRLGVKRIGFAGTLDPLASGLMIMAFGEYTKLLSWLEAEDKVYEVVIRLDGLSDTYDQEGEIRQLDPKSYSRPSLADVSKKIEQNFLGKINQIPPRFSAIKIKGKKAYEMARAHQEFEMKSRQIEVFSIDLVDYDFPRLNLKIHCSSGTYIRSLAFDLGKSLGVGGYVEQLRRIKIGDIEVGSASDLKKICSDELNQYLARGEELFQKMPNIMLTEASYLVLARGNFIPNSLPKNEFLDFKKPILAIYKDFVVGVLESCEEETKLKFKKKLNIF